MPLVKDKQGDLANIDNYRGITLSSTLSKLFEMCLLELYGDYLQSSDLQFGFKKKIGCSNAVYTVRSVVDYYVCRGSTVNVCMLDMSKAFDKINHYALYIKLIKRNVPCTFLRVIINWYAKCTAVVRWNSAYSETFKVMCGVRQGGVLSPVLFAVYVNDLIERLKKSRLGCFVTDLYWAVLCMQMTLYYYRHP